MATARPASTHCSRIRARCCDERFGAEWHLSPEQSILLHAEQNGRTPPQVIIHSPEGDKTIKLPLPFGTPIFDLRQRIPAADDLDGARQLACLHSARYVIRGLNLSFRIILSKHRWCSDRFRMLRRAATPARWRSQCGGWPAGWAFRAYWPGQRFVTVRGDHARAADCVVREIDLLAGASTVTVVSRRRSRAACARCGRGCGSKYLARFRTPPGLPRKKTAFLLPRG